MRSVSDYLTTFYCSFFCVSLSFSGGLHCITKATRVNKSTECFFLFFFQFIYWNLCSCCCCVCFCGSHYSLCHPILQTINAPLIAFCYRSGSSDWLAPLCPSQSSYRVFFSLSGFEKLADSIRPLIGLAVVVFSMVA